MPQRPLAIHWQSNGCYRRDGHEPLGLDALLRRTTWCQLDSLDDPNGPPEPVAQVRVLPGASLPGAHVPGRVLPGHVSFRIRRVTGGTIVPRTTLRSFS